MPLASSLKDLLRIRDANRSAIESINGNLGSALGIKKSRDPSSPGHNKPAIIIFVPQKVDSKWVPPSGRIPDKLQGPDGLECPTDVVEGRKFQDYQLLHETSGGLAKVPWSALKGLPELSAGQIELRDQLRGWSDSITPGSQLAVSDGSSRWFGTLGFFGRDKATNQVGLITNHHVVGSVGQALHYASSSAIKLATATKAIEWDTDESRFDNLIDEADAQYRIDCAFAPLESTIDPNDISFDVPVIQNDAVARVAMGDPLILDLSTMGPIGQRVIGTGRTMSFQRGTITAFAYEFRDELGVNLYTDYLIAGDDPYQFSAPGDSGKLILTDELVPRPVALLWGGWIEKLSNYRGQIDWSYGIDINYVLKRLNVELAR